MKARFRKTDLLTEESGRAEALINATSVESCLSNLAMWRGLCTKADAALEKHRKRYPSVNAHNMTKARERLVRAYVYADCVQGEAYNKVLQFIRDNQ